MAFLPFYLQDTSLEACKGGSSQDLRRYLPDGKPFQGDPRYVLKSAIKEAQNMGFSMQVGPEIEFFLFKLDANGNPTTELTDQGGYFDFAPRDRAQDVRREIDYALEYMGLSD